MKWEMVKLGKLVKVSTGKYDVNHSVEDGAYPFYTCALNPFRSNTYSFDGDLIMLPGNGANVGEVMYYSGKVEAYQRTYVLHEISTDPRFLYFYLKSCWKQTLANQQFGSATNYIRLNNITDLQIPLPPLPIQRRIADILDKADALRRKDRALLERYDALAQSVFMDMFGDPVRNEKGWEVRKLGEGLEHLQIGPFGTQLHESDYIFDGVPVINPMHINNLKITPNPKYSIKHEKYLTLSQYHLKENDIILARRGEMGRAALVTKEGSKYLCGTGSLFLRVDKNKFEPLFLVYLLSQKSTKSALENVASGTTMPNLNKGIIYDFDVIFPDVGLQKKFIDAIIYTEQSTDLTLKSTTHSESLFQSLLQRAFKGEL